MALVMESSVRVSYYSLSFNPVATANVHVSSVVYNSFLVT